LSVTSCAWRLASGLRWCITSVTAKATLAFPTFLIGRDRESLSCAARLHLLIRTLRRCTASRLVCMPTSSHLMAPSFVRRSKPVRHSLDIPSHGRRGHGDHGQYERLVVEALANSSGSGHGSLIVSAEHGNASRGASSGKATPRSCEISPHVACPQVSTSFDSESVRD
jgi:hypothetical protein